MLSAFLSISFLLLAAVGAAEVQNISAVIRGEVTLPCSAKGYMPLEEMEWSRPRSPLQYVVIFRSQSPDIKIPEQRYEGRVELVDVKNGNVSLVLKNLKPEDGGIYECYVKRENSRRKRAIQPVSTVYLDVLPPPPPGNKDEEDKPLNIRAYIADVVAACVVMAVIVSLMAVAVIRWKKKNYRPSAQDEAETSQIA